MADRHCPTCSCPPPPPEPKPGGPCEGFRWIGQPFSSCDRCGRPYWEHTHVEQVRRDVPLFSEDSVELVPITPEDAEAVRRRWAGW